ncbi:hypothetical protein ACHAXR_007223 [Thalassiosira sp. AJA248-18]
MGCSSSKAFTADSGTEAEYKAMFEEKKVLGEGEFGVVKLVVKKNDPASEPYAVKALNKGFVFKDNTLYTPMKPEVLTMEIDILRVLGGKHFNLTLDSVYESSSKVYVVTEVCAGGEMLEYTSKTMAEGLRTEDVSRIAYQLLSALNHCESHNILHRDLKPENIMFKSSAKTAELRLIDFGCATMDEEKGEEHVTFAGTPFYISPEMFQKKYTTKTDIFSVGVVLYVLVAGYPAGCLQEAFNLLHKAKRDLKTLPGMPEDMPDTYYEMLDKMLTYRWKGRKSAAEMLDDEFVVFHKALGDKSPKRRSMMRTQSIVLAGTGEKAAAAFGFTKFHRALTTILAAIMVREDIVALVSKAEAHVAADDTLDSKLGVIKIKDLKSILEDMGNKECVVAIEKQKNADKYDNYSYEYTVLKHFTESQDSAYSGEADAKNALSSSVKFLPKKLQASTRDLSSSESWNRSKRNNMAKSKSVFIRGI